MYSKKHYLSKKKDFDNVWQSKKSKYLKYLGVKTIHNNIDSIRFAVVISTKVSKKAVIRNSIKRKIKKVVLEKIPEIKNGYDIIILGLAKTLNSKTDIEVEEIRKELNIIFKKLNLYK